MDNWLIPLGVLILFEIIADVLAKTWSIKGGSWYALSSIGAYVIANTFWLFALRNGSGLGRGALIFSVASAILAVVIGLIFYKETLTTLQIVGIVLGLFSLVFIFWE